MFPNLLRRHFRLLPPLCLGMALLAGVFTVTLLRSVRADVKPLAGPPDALRPFLAAHCFDCHGEKTAKGDLRLDTLSADFGDPKTAETWAKVRERLRAGEMPPKKRPRPPEAEARAALSWLDGRLPAAPARPPVVRRLNRVEYENTLRDLFDMPGLDVKDYLPQDDGGKGFDTSAQALDVSYVQMARYLEAADVALDRAAASALRPTKPEVQKVKFWPQDSYDWYVRLCGGAVVALTDKGLDPVVNKETGVLDNKVDLRKLPRIKALGTFFHSDPAGRLRFNSGINVPTPGYYRLRVSAYGFDWDKGELRPAKGSRPFNLTTDTRTLGYFDAPPNEPTVSTITTWLDPDDLIQFNAVSLQHGFGLQKGVMSFTGPGVAVEWLEAEGPLVETWPSAARQLLFGDLPVGEWKSDAKTKPPPRLRPAPKLYSVTPRDPMADAERLLRAFLTRVCRRPTPDEEARRYLPLVRMKLDQNASFEEAMRTAYKAVLCSPDFLYLRAEPGRADGYALAARLSYFLWSSTPDAELLRLAADGSLRKPEMLRAQTERLLNDPKSRRFVENFTGQWLRLRDINATQPDRTLYPEAEWESDVACYMTESMVDETRQFFAAMLRDDLSVTNVIDSDFVVVNEPLAKLYGIPGVEGAAFRPVKLPPGSHRGGILTQGAVLKVTANGTTTSPVVRGAWVMSRLLGKPPQPPPPNVPAIDPDVRGATTIREQLAKHRSQETCAACHANIDPPGFALESYDVLGGWRDHYRTVGTGAKRPAVDPSGETPDGRRFADIDAFKKLLLADPDQLTRNLASQLLVYAAGAPLTPVDRSEIEEIVVRMRAGNRGLRSLLHQVVQSKAFVGE